MAQLFYCEDCNLMFGHSDGCPGCDNGDCKEVADDFLLPPPKQNHKNTENMFVQMEKLAEFIRNEATEDDVSAFIEIFRPVIDSLTTRILNRTEPSNHGKH